MCRGTWRGRRAPSLRTVSAPAQADDTLIRPALDWFGRRGWTPFAYQREAGMAYLRGRSGLVHAPTGTGKTLSVFVGPLLEALAAKRPERERAGLPA